MAMFARTIRSSLLETRATLPPTFLLPFRARITTVSHTLETGNVPEPLIQSGQHISKDLKSKIQAAKDARASASSTLSTSESSTQSRTDETPSPLTPSIKKLLPLLHSQPAHYLTLHIHGRPYLLTKGDTLRLPFCMPNVQPGDVLRLNRATHIGSRDYTLKAPEPVKGTLDAPKRSFYLDERLFVCRATVIGVESEPMRIKEKTKRRQRHIRRVKSKHRYTILKISDMEVKSLEEYQSELERDEERIF
ncbi:hypothetical protein K469DRAFT_705358 [Zopfia rhizophila CBS 207.26]|uniref:Large ribosomal subunit protein bL21m n=1 Tax=Zopfia rhizophila CBS 207.26 TaxID=1314779 RepID=A0A6A6EAG4_9PEZI|nr:hypothetical protein K469DRAFT_705358 [Zopfia rhizophila CBS 207.26]